MKPQIVTPTNKYIHDTFSLNIYLSENNLIRADLK